MLCLVARLVEILALENDILDPFLDPCRRPTMRRREQTRTFLSVLVRSFPANGADQYQTKVPSKDPSAGISLEVLVDGWFPQSFWPPSFFAFW